MGKYFWGFLEFPHRLDTLDRSRNGELKAPRRPPSPTPRLPVERLVRDSLDLQRGESDLGIPSGVLKIDAKNPEVGSGRFMCSSSNGLTQLRLFLIQQTIDACLKKTTCGGVKLKPFIVLAKVPSSYEEQQFCGVASEVGTLDLDEPRVHPLRPRTVHPFDQLSARARRGPKRLASSWKVRTHESLYLSKERHPRLK